MSIVIIDFDAGNLLSVQRAFHHLGAEVRFASSPEHISQADRLVLPGVGAFGACMEGLKARNLVTAVRDFALSGRPFLGICVGMQMLFEESFEFGRHAGLGIVPGQIRPIPREGAAGPHRIPHIGWSSLQARRSWADSILADVGEGDAVYFVHSFMGVCANPDDLLATTDYDGVPITAAVHHGNITGCQFHPEKSGTVGLGVLRRFMTQL
ncbi:imidazole glycerol phosphate synthase subunit HisH [Magnetospirillum gryphiswaldense]|uniref:Imidazole glycerol phosphate synthase subunit HisH n=1 Tax=Magnetospirillum gryphiswaldense TaxID=55518 RepID=A4U3N9_9PROT|nr:imidazole glycerol phosphate synthase subunit HisH [Magnetospirillum gryphiswaldense]AVM74861.1 Imidazole glycerol phosphate synthase subunit HisH 1 [Magnetospirillum gryphiswaldense MSR-1]AVM78764.1 Imidazole glycerol phosphate synthase subunit HisH 1 [Magnetospirillum gryphiswaldense]CAM77496.1 Imidazole glycerol phosphate synthase, glutamine amidotransferase subunit [Magnetospirillum gryphiswaldense MSR-1]